MNQKEREEAFRKNAPQDKLTEERRRELRRLREERRKREKRRRFIGYGLMLVMAAAAVGLVVLISSTVGSLVSRGKEKHPDAGSTAEVVTLPVNASAVASVDASGEETPAETEEEPQNKLTDGPPWAKVDYLTPNPYSRPGTALPEIKNIVIHYVGNPNTTAQANRDYFEQLKNNTGTSASSHFVVGLEGEVVQCVPLNEVAYATKWRNVDTISIEVCHPDAEGKFNEKTYNGLIRLTAWLCRQYGLTGNDLLRHFDVTQKKCPLYYVDHPEAWEQLKQDVNTYLQSGQE